MSKYAYIEKAFKAPALALIQIANSIIAEYQQQGYVLTIRQLYYQLVARDVIPNTLQEYKRVAGVFNDARLAGVMDWDAITDRTREFLRRPRWVSGAHALRSVARQYHMDMWENQAVRVFVVVEKEALVGVFERVCNRYDIPVLAARGYPSVSVVREFVEQDIIPAVDNDQTVHILHFGDHDPSGIDMSRDLRNRFDLFLEGQRGYEFERCALNMEQIEELNPPENPAKITDSRFADYARKYGTSSWELDALPPKALEELVVDHVEALYDGNMWEEKQREISTIRSRIEAVAEDFE
jgi:hypothetical protein